MKKNALFPIFFVFFLDNFGFALVIPLLAPLLLNPEYGLLSKDVLVSTRNLLLGLLIAAYPFAQFFGAPLFGEFSDRFGRKKAFYFTISGILVGYLISGFSLLGSHFWLFFVSRLITGFFSGNLSICLAAISDMSPDAKERAKNFGLIATLAGVSWIIAMIVGGDVSDPQILHFFNPSLPFWITAFLSFLSLLAIGKLFKETHPFDSREIKFNFGQGIRHIILSFKLKQVRVFYLVHFLWLLGWVIAIQWFSGYSIERYHVSQERFTTVFIILGVVWSFGSSIINRILIQNYSLTTICLAGLLLISISFAIGFKAPTFEIFSLFYLISALIASFVWSNILNLISISASGEVQGKVMGVGQSMMAFAQVIGPIIAGVIATKELKYLFGYTALFVFVAFLILLIQQSFKRKKT